MLHPEINKSEQMAALYEKEQEKKENNELQKKRAKIDKEFSIFLNSTKSKSELTKAFPLKEKEKFSMIQKEMTLIIFQIKDAKQDISFFAKTLKEFFQYVDILKINGMEMDLDECAKTMHDKIIEIEPENISEYYEMLSDGFKEICVILQEKEYTKNKKGLIFMQSEDANELRSRGYNIIDGPSSFRSDYTHKTEKGLMTTLLNLYIINDGMKYSVIRELKSQGKMFEEEYKKDTYGLYNNARGISLESGKTESNIIYAQEAWERYKNEIEG